MKKPKKNPAAVKLGKLGGRPRSEGPRCKCERYTLSTATKIRHKCPEVANA